VLVHPLTTSLPSEPVVVIEHGTVEVLTIVWFETTVWVVVTGVVTVLYEVSVRGVVTVL
jgi:hypothetical protein